MSFETAELQLIKQLVERRGSDSYKTSEWLSFLKSASSDYLTDSDFKTVFNSLEELRDAVKLVYFSINGEDYSNRAVAFAIGITEKTSVYVTTSRDLTVDELDIIEETLKVTLEQKDTNVYLLKVGEKND